MMESIKLVEKLSRIREYWSPKIVAQVNDTHVKLAKLKGEFEWHHHELEDELFYVLKGTLTMQFRNGEVQIREGEFLVVPRGTEHRPVAEEEVHVLLIEPAGTINTGNVTSTRTIQDPGWV